jgi:hypothetical protein
MLILFASMLATLASILRSRAALVSESLALRHPIGVLQRSADGGGKKLGHFGGVSGATVVVDIWNCGSAYNERTDGRLKSRRALMV